MKTLFIVRHAKSSWDSPGIRDFDRPLMEIGKKRTRKVIQFFLDKKVRIDLIISSPAVRAYETAKIIAKGIGYPIKSIKLEPDIYEGEPDRIIDMICRTDNDYSGLMIVGHNPSLTYLTNHFLKPGIEILPTSGVAAISFKADSWENIPGADASCEFLLYPKQLKK